MPFLDSSAGEQLRRCFGGLGERVDCGNVGCGSGGGDEWSEGGWREGNGEIGVGAGQEAGRDGGVEGHVVLFVRGTHGSCRGRSRCVVNTAELALALTWVSERVRCLPPRCGQAGASQTPRDRRQQTGSAQSDPGCTHSRAAGEGSRPRAGDMEQAATTEGESEGDVALEGEGAREREGEGEPEPEREHEREQEGRREEGEGDGQGGIRIRGGVHVVRTEERSHSLGQLVSLLQVLQKSPAESNRALLRAKEPC